MAREPGEREPPEERERVGLERHLATFVEDSALWPVLLVGVLVFITGAAALLLLALGDRNFFAMAALLVLLWQSVDFLVRRRRFGVAGGLIVTFWVLSGLAALGFLAFGLF